MVHSYNFSHCRNYSTIFSVFVPIHKEGYKYIGIFAAVTLIFLWIGLDFRSSECIMDVWYLYRYYLSSNNGKQRKTIVAKNNSIPINYYSNYIIRKLRKLNTISLYIIGNIFTDIFTYIIIIL